MRSILQTIVTALLLTAEATKPGTWKTVSAAPLDDEFSRRATKLYLEGHFETAAGLFLASYQAALRHHHTGLARRSLGNMASMYFAMFRYREAQSAYLRARELRNSDDDPKQRAGSLAAMDANLSSLALQLGDLNGAERYAHEALAAAGALTPNNRARLYLQLGMLAGKRLDFRTARAYLRRAIDAADSVPDWNSEAACWDALGETYLSTSQLKPAETAFITAYRIRKLQKDRDLRLSYFKLSRLRLAQRDFPSAILFADAALLHPGQDAGSPLWQMYYQRGLVNQALGRADRAWADFQEAVRLSRQWREQLVPSDSLRSAAFGNLREIYDSAIEADANRSRAASQRAFLLTEDLRAGALLQTFVASEAGNHNLPLRYWQTLARFRAAQSALLAHPSVESRQLATSLEYTLSEVESQYSAPSGNIPGKKQERFLGRPTLSDIQESLTPGEALLSFHLGKRDSLLWTVTRDRFAWHRLESKQALVDSVVAFRSAVEAGSRGRDALGQSLFTKLFGRVSSEVRSRRNWLIAADDALFDLPFSALVVKRRGGGPVYLMEQHATERIPSAVMLSRRANSWTSGAFLGLGDPIYNTADPRLRASFAAREPQLQLPRLLGSATELRNCSRRWRGQSTILTGRQAVRRELTRSLAKPPAVIHLATHVLQPPDHPADATLALSLEAQTAAPDLLTKQDIMNLRLPGSTVVMSGCSSAAGGAVNGAGVLGLSRAWLVAGARAVVGSRWPTPDDTGALFSTFYTDLSQRQSGVPQRLAVAEALRQAQITMLHSHTWRSDPKYWAAYYVVGKE